MRSLGLSGMPLRVVDAGQEPKLRAGVSIFLEVQGEVAPGLWRVSGAGGSYLARSGLPLESGALLKARVERSAAGLVFRLEPGAAGAVPLPEGSARLDAVLERLGLAPDRLGREALSALLAEGVKPEAQALLRMKRVALAPAGQARAGGADSPERRLRLAALLEAKGLASDAEAVDVLSALLDGETGLASGPGGEGDSGAGRRGTRRQGDLGGDAGRDAGRGSAAGRSDGISSGDPNASGPDGRPSDSPADRPVASGPDGDAVPGLVVVAVPEEDLPGALGRLLYGLARAGDGAGSAEQLAAETEGAGAVGTEGAGAAGTERSAGAGTAGPGVAGPGEASEDGAASKDDAWSADGAGAVDGSAPVLALLRLFNHARQSPGNGDWVILPFRFSLDRVAFAGSLGILLPYVSGGPGRMEARFRAGPEGPAGDGSQMESWSFTLHFGSGKPRLVVGAVPGRSRTDSLLSGLGSLLEGTGCAIEAGGDGGPRRDGSFDLEA